MPRTPRLTMKAPQVSQKAEPWFRFKNVSDTAVEIEVYGEIGGWSFWDDDSVSASSFKKELKDAKGKDVVVHVNSPGGNVFDGLAIYNALKQHDGEVRVVVDALAASAASFICMAADPGQLVMARNAVMMIHDAAGMAFGNASDMREMADLLDMHSDNIADIYSQRTSEDAAFWRMAMVAETWYTGAEAVTAGLADSTLEDENEEAEKVANKFDLSIFNHAGREKAPSPTVIHKRIKASMAQAKENAVSGTPAPPKVVKNEGENPPVEGEQKPEEEQTPAGNEPTEQAGATGDGGEQQGSEPTETPGQPAAAQAVENKGGLVAVVVNGATFQVPAPVATELTAFRAAEDEAKVANRKAFVASLASGPAPKISAVQLEATETFALALSDDQWASWTATWDAAPSNPLFAKHGEGTSNHDGSGSTPVNEREARIELLESIVAHHTSAGRPKEVIENMASYKELQQLKSQQSTES